jgi:hypothetical protein
VVLVATDHPLATARSARRPLEVSHLQPGLQGIAGNKKGECGLRLSFLAIYIQTMVKICLNYY